jgi:hypothetical protein
MPRSVLSGTTYPVASPLFLQFTDTKSSHGLDEGVVDVLDPDLDLLAEDEGAEIRIGDSDADTQELGMEAVAELFGGEIIPGSDFEIAYKPDNYNSDFVLNEEALLKGASRFADEPISLQAEQPASPAQVAVPEGLGDISDLAPPAEGLTEQGMKGNLELDKELDLFLGGDKDSATNDFVLKDDLPTLSLDDIDLSGGLVAAPLQTPSCPVDNKLDFNLDLGTVYKGKGGVLKKVSDDIPDFSLSLD